MKNTVARILKGYAVVNAFAGIIIGIMVDIFINNALYDGGAIAFGAFVIVAGMTAVASFAIYAFGELIQLVQDVKDNTMAASTGANPVAYDYEIPEI